MSDTPPGEEEFEGSGLFEGSGIFEGSGTEEDGSGLDDGGEDDDEEGPLYYFLEESTGYMEPAMAFFGIVHTIISFLCIIGYNCLKVCERFAFLYSKKVLGVCFHRFHAVYLLNLHLCKVPLVIFKREKELARKLEFDGLYVTEQPEDDDIKGQWDRLVLNTP